MKTYDLIVVGGGPAGFFGALRFAELCPKASVLILEKGDTLLQKVLISGGGRCNISHDCNDPNELIKAYPRGGKALRNAFYQFGPAQLIKWFETRGLKFYIDTEGCYFPVTDKAQSVVHVLLDGATRLGIQLRTGAGVQSIQRKESSLYYKLGLSDGAEVSAPLVLIASGGNRQMLKILRDFGVQIEKPVPSLFSFKLDEPALLSLAGITLEEVLVTLPQTDFRHTGALLITHRGLSGPAVINLSSKAARRLWEEGYQHPLWIDWLPSLGNTYYSLTTLRGFKHKNGWQVVEKASPFQDLPERLWKTLVRRTGIADSLHWADLSNAQMDALNLELRRGAFQIVGRDPHRQEYVTCGGVSLKQVDLSGFESKLHAGVCFAGEVLDIDGLTGGYNFQNCWSTAWVAASRLAQRFEQMTNIQNDTIRKIGG